MKTVTKVFIIIAICCVVIGSMIFSIGGAIVDFNFNEIGAEKANYQLVTKDFSVSEFEEFNLTVKNLYVKFEKSADEKIHLNFYESDLFENNFVQSKNTISLHRRSNSWFNFNFSFDKNVVTVELPTNYDPKMNLNVDNGGLDILGFTFSKDTALDVDNGTLNIENSTLNGNVNITGNNGVLNIDSSTFGKNVDFDLRNTVNNFDNCSFAGSTKIENSNALLKFKDTSFSTFSARASNGDIRFDRVSGNDFNFEVSNSSIRGEIAAKESDFTIMIATQNGSSNLKNQAATTGNKKFVADVNNGTIDLSFIG